MNQHALFAAHVAPKTNAWLRQARNEIARCRDAATTWHVRTEWHGVARGLQMANAITQDLREQITAAIDQAVTDHTDRLRQRAATNRVDEE